MKTKYTLVFLSFFLLIATAAEANPPAADSTATKIGFVDSSGREVAAITKADKQRFSLSVGGLMVDFENRKEENRKGNERRPSFNIGSPAIGFIGLTAPDYSMYPAGTGRFLLLDNARSISVSIDAGVFSLPLGRADKTRLITGLRLKWDNYAFRERLTLEKQDGMIFPVEIPAERGRFKKSKLTTFSLNVPVALHVKINRIIYLEGGMYADLVLRQHTKVKFPKEWTVANFGVNFFQFGLGGEIGIRKVGSIYFRHGITPLFENGSGPKTRPFSVGIRWRW